MTVIVVLDIVRRFKFFFRIQIRKLDLFLS
jgi:hypothetical protein